MKPYTMALAAVAAVAVLSFLQSLETARYLRARGLMPRSGGGTFTA